MGFIDHIRRLNAHDKARYRPFLIEDRPIGFIPRRLAERLLEAGGVFRARGESLALAEELADPRERAAAVAAVLAELHAQGHLPAPRGEDFPVLEDWGRPQLMTLDRAYAAHLGIKAFGVHLNGFVGRGATMRLWIGRRAPDKSVEPDKLDNLVAGGQPAGLSLMANLIKEAAEEAGIGPELAGTARPVGAITYCMDLDATLRRDTLFVYDLALDEAFTPRNTDGEIASFRLMTVDECLGIVRDSRDFKFNVALVMIDFFIRHGFLSPDSEPDYDRLARGLHARLD